MNSISLPQTGRSKKGGVFLLFLVLEAMVFAILPLSARLSINVLLITHAGLTAILLIAALFLRRSERGQRYSQVLYAFFVAALAVLVSTLFSGGLLRLFGLTATNPVGIAVAKFFESVWRVIPVLVLMAIVGADRRSMYLNKGKIGVGLAWGLGGFVILAAIAFIPLISQAGMLNRLLSLSPWILLFVLVNGLWRGCFSEDCFSKGMSRSWAKVYRTS